MRQNPSGKCTDRRKRTNISPKAREMKGSLRKTDTETGVQRGTKAKENLKQMKRQTHDKVKTAHTLLKVSFGALLVMECRRWRAFFKTGEAAGGRLSVPRCNVKHIQRFSFMGNSLKSGKRTGSNLV